MKTKVVYISGAHGVGKDSIILTLARRLEKAGMSMWTFPEFPFPPDIPTGSMDFQVKYKKVMEVREEMITHLQEKGYFDYIICNRHPIDVDVYTERINGDKVRKIITRNNDMRILITADDLVVNERLTARLERETWRTDWNELDIEYFNIIQNGFLALQNASKSWFWSMFDVFDVEDLNFFREVKNDGTIEEAVEKIMELIY